MTTTIGQILIVDDAPINIEILIAIFEDDYDIVVAMDGEQAIKLAKSAHPDLILLDVMMPGLNGYQVCSILKQDANTKDIPVIFVTGLGEEQAEAKGFDSGAVDYVTKPISAGIVRRRVLNHIELKRARDNLAELALTLERKNNELLLLRERDQEDMAIANDIMNHIMHSDELNDPSIRYFQRPAQQFSGDFIAAGRDNKGDLRIMLADVTGHGLQAALFLLPIFRIFRTMVRKGLPTREIVTEINTIMHEISGTGRFIAAVIAHIRYDTASIEIWNGGIASAYYVENNGNVHCFESRHLALGLLRTPDTNCEILTASPGTLIICSDGLTEAENSSGVAFGEAALQTILRNSPPKELLDNLLTAVDAHLAGHAAHDDLSIVMALM